MGEWVYRLEIWDDQDARVEQFTAFLADHAVALAYHPTTEGEGVGRQQEMKAFSASRRNTKQEKPYNCGKASPVFLIFPRAAVRLNDGDGLGRPLAWTSTVS